VLGVPYPLISFPRFSFPLAHVPGRFSGRNKQAVFGIAARHTALEQEFRERKRDSLTGLSPRQPGEVLMSPQSKVVTIPTVELNLDQFLSVIRQLDEPTRVQVARVLAETEMDAQLRNLIAQLGQTSPAFDISDADIQTEIDSVRRRGS
jgi:hypothetical protein